MLINIPYVGPYGNVFQCIRMAVWRVQSKLPESSPWSWRMYWGSFSDPLATPQSRKSFWDASGKPWYSFVTCSFGACHWSRFFLLLSLPLFSVSPFVTPSFWDFWWGKTTRRKKNTCMAAAAAMYLQLPCWSREIDRFFRIVYTETGGLKNSILRQLGLIRPNGYEWIRFQSTPPKKPRANVAFCFSRSFFHMAKKGRVTFWVGGGWKRWNRRDLQDGLFTWNFFSEVFVVLLHGKDWGILSKMTCTAL